MLKLYKNTDTAFTRWVESKLQDMVVAHNIVAVSDSKPLPAGISFNDLPVLSNSHEIWKKQEQIEAYLEELNREVNLSRSLQSDACHINPDNPDRCL